MSGLQVGFRWLLGIACSLGLSGCVSVSGNWYLQKERVAERSGQGDAGGATASQARTRARETRLYLALLNDSGKELVTNCITVFTQPMSELPFASLPQVMWQCRPKAGANGSVDSAKNWSCSAKCDDQATNNPAKACFRSATDEDCGTSEEEIGQPEATIQPGRVLVLNLPRSTDQARCSLPVSAALLRNKGSDVRILLSGSLPSVLPEELVKDCSNGINEER